MIQKCFKLFPVLSPYAFSICDTTGPEYKAYQYGGIARQVKTSSSFITFVSDCWQYLINKCFLIINNDAL